MQELLNGVSNGKGLMVHHWDADGISSGAQLKAAISAAGGEIDTMTLQIGNFYFTSEEMERIGLCRPAYVIVADMCIAKENLLEMQQHAGCEVLLFDHHVQVPIPEVFHHNPVAHGSDPEEYPSASWVVTKYLAREPDLLSFLGAAGDHEKKLLENGTFAPKLERWLNENGMTFDELLKLVHLLDSSYKLNDKVGVEAALDSVLKGHREPAALLERKDWLANLNLLEKEIERWMGAGVEELGDLQRMTIDTEFALISTITRRLHWTSKKKVTMVVNRGFRDGSQLYIRGRDGIDLMGILGKARARGLVAGGKMEVVGMVLPEGKEGFMDVILEQLAAQGVRTDA